MSNKYSTWLADWMVEQYTHIKDCPRAVNDAVGKLIIKILFVYGKGW